MRFPRRRLAVLLFDSPAQARDPRLPLRLPARHLPPRAATSPAAHAVFDLLDTDRDGVVRRAEFFDAVGAVNRSSLQKGR